MNTTKNRPYSFVEGHNLSDAEIIRKYNLITNSEEEVLFITFKFMDINIMGSKMFPEEHKEALAWAKDFAKAYELTIQENECSPLLYLLKYIEDQCDGNPENMFYTHLPTEFANVFAKHFMGKK